MRLGDVCTKIGSGATPKGGKEAYKPSGIPLIRSQNVLDWSFTSNGLAFVDEGQAAALANVEVEPRDILLNITGDSVARACMVPDWCTPARVNQHVSIVRPGPDLDPTFLLCFLQSSKPLLLKLASSGATRNALTKGMIGDLEIELPNIETQRAIASLIGQIQQKIVLNQQTNDYLAELGKMIWAQTAKQAAKTVKIAEVAADIVTGKTPSTKKPDNYGEEYPFITIPDMHSAVWLCSTERCLSEVGNSSQPKKLVQRGSVLVSCIATVGLVGIVQKPSHFNQQINAVIPANEGDEFYLYYAMHSIKQELLGIGATGSATLNVNKGAFSNIEIPWPERSAMDAYVRTVEPLFKAIEANTLESLRLQELRDTLLPKLMSGEIDVSKVEI